MESGPPVRGGHRFAAFAMFAMLVPVLAGCAAEAPPPRDDGAATLPPHTVPELAPIPAPVRAPAPVSAPEPTPTTGDSRADATHTLPAVPILRALRVGEQPGADRLVFEFDGDGLPGKPIGTVWIGWKRRGGYPRAQLFHFSGDREAVRRQTVDAALRGLLALAG